MWEAATHHLPIILFPVSGKGFVLEEAVALLGDLAGQMDQLNPYCMAEVMKHGAAPPDPGALSGRGSAHAQPRRALMPPPLDPIARCPSPHSRDHSSCCLQRRRHSLRPVASRLTRGGAAARRRCAAVRKQDVTDVREVEDVLLAAMGLVPSLERRGAVLQKGTSRLRSGSARVWGRFSCCCVALWAAPFFTPTQAGTAHRRPHTRHAVRRRRSRREARGAATSTCKQPRVVALRAPPRRQATAAAARLAAMGHRQPDPRVDPVPHGRVRRGAGAARAAMGRRHMRDGQRQHTTPRRQPIHLEPLFGLSGRAAARQQRQEPLSTPQSAQSGAAKACRRDGGIGPDVAVAAAAVRHERGRLARADAAGCSLREARMRSGASPQKRHSRAHLAHTTRAKPVARVMRRPTAACVC